MKAVYALRNKLNRNDLPMRPIFIPLRANARNADCAPGPGVLVLWGGKKNY